MTPHERIIGDDASALTALDIHHGMLLGCPPSDLRRPGWHILVTRPEGDPTQLLFGRRHLAQLIAPAAGREEERAGVALVAAELRAPLAVLLRSFSPTRLFTPSGRVALDTLMRSLAGDEITSAEAAHQHLCYTFGGMFRPYIGQWLEWIEPLDEAREMDPVALSLLARFSRGAYVIRQRGRIAAYAGLRQHSPHVWDVTARTLVETLLGHGLGRAVASRATRAVLAEGRLPLSAHPAGDRAAAHIAAALGYRLYGEALTYTAAT
jgi:hypothetical protein